MNIQKATIGDTEAIISLLSQLSPPSDDGVSCQVTGQSKGRIKEIMQKILNDSGYLLCIAKEDGRVIGTGLLLIQMNLSHAGNPSGHIENIVVDKDYRGKGIGKEIVMYLIGFAKKKGCYKVILDCKEDNAKFYENCNMRRTGEVQMRF